MTSDHAKNVMRKMLDGFINDPPDNEYQIGYLEGLVVFAHDALGMRMDDRSFREASDIAYAQVIDRKPERKAFMVIDGGMKP